MSARLYRFEATLDHPRPLRVELHPQDCGCNVCAPVDRLGAVQLGKLTLAGIAAGHVVAAAIWGPATVWHVLVANLTGTAL